MLLKNKRTIADPQSKWLKTVLLKFTKETISDKNFVSKDIIDNHELSKLLQIWKIQKVILTHHF